jgi:uncharacterized membrane protein
MAVLLLALLAAVVVALHVTRPPIRYNTQAASLEETVQARVRNVLEESSSTDQNGLVLVSQQLELKILSSGAYHGSQITVAYNGMGPSLQAVRFRKGERALVMVSQRPDGQTFFQVADHVRLTPLAAIVALFVVITLITGRWQGLRAILGLVLSGLLIGGFVLPQILAHRDPVLVSLMGTALLLAVTLYLIQGWNTTGHAAILGMLSSLAFTGLLAILCTNLSYLTGFGSEETMFLQAVGVGVEMRGLLLAGMIIGAAGVLDDVVLAQAVTVFELAEADTSLSRRDLYRRGMKVGVAHLASMINTLVLAYASAALPLLLLFFLYPEPWYLTINRELIAEEIVRTLVGSVGLMVAVPLTTLIAAWATPARRQPPEPSL